MPGDSSQSRSSCRSRRIAPNVRTSFLGRVRRPVDENAGHDDRFPVEIGAPRKPLGTMVSISSSGQKPEDRRAASNGQISYAPFPIPPGYTPTWYFKEARVSTLSGVGHPQKRFDL